MTSWRQLDGPARAIGRAIDTAVTAARNGDGTDFELAAAALAALPPEQTGLVLGAVVRRLLEQRHPDGLDSDDLRLLLAGCYQRAAAWVPAASLDVESLVAVLSSALGIHEPGVTYTEITEITTPAGRTGAEWVDPDTATIGANDRSGRVRSLVPTAAQYAWHATLLTADLLSAGSAPLSRFLDSAFDEIAVGERMEMP